MNRLSTIVSDEGQVTSDTGHVTSDKKRSAEPGHLSPVTCHLSPAPPRGGKRGQRFVRVVQVCRSFMALSEFARTTAWCWLLAITTSFAYGQTGFVSQGGEYGVAGTLPGDQVFPALSLKSGGGYLVWQDNRTDGDGLGVSALRLDSSFSAPLSSFRVNENGALDQSKPVVSLLNDGGAVFAWQGGRQGFQHIYARFLSSSNTWLTGDIAVNTFTNDAQINPAVATLSNGNVIVVWGSFNQQSANSLQDVYAQRFSPAGQKLGNEFLVNLSTAYNQRSPAVAALSDGRYVVVWVKIVARTRPAGCWRFAD